MLKIFKIALMFLFVNSPVIAEIVNKIEINGNSRVSDETIKIYGDIQLNINYEQKGLNQILRNLYETNFFEDVNLKISNNTLIINLKEYPTINQLIILGEKNNRIKKEIEKIISLKAKGSFIKADLAKDIEKIKNIYSSIGYNNAIIEAKTKMIEKKIDLIFDINPGTQTKISSINFIGDKKISNNRLRDIIASEEHKFWKVISKNTKFSEQLVLLDERLIRNYLKSIGYYDVKVSSSSAVINKNNNVDLIYSIEAGERYVINKISTNVEPVFDKEIFSPMQNVYKKFIGDFYSPFSIKDILVELDELIEDNNLQFVEHNVEEIISGTNIELKFNIFESDKILVNRIDVLGNNVTEEDVIRGELLVDEGDPFSQLSLEKSISNLKALRIFQNVDYIVSDVGNNLKNISINVEEKPTGEVSAGAGVGSNGGTFAIIVTENNWLGKGNTIDFELDVDSESLGGRLNYTDNNHNFTGSKLNYFISSVSNDKPNQGYENTVVSSGINKSFEQFKDINLNLGLAASYDDLRTQSNASNSLKKQSGDFSEISGSYGISSDKRNRSFMPTKGYFSSFNQSIPLYADKKSLTNEFSLSNFKSLSEGIVGASKLYVSSINGLDNDDVRLSKRRNLSTRRLRGFEKGKVGPVDGKDHVGGNYAASLSLEANFYNLLPDSTNTEIGTFLDFGNVWGVDYDESLDESNELRSSAGLAINWGSPIGPMSFVLSTNLQKANTDKTQSFSFNLGTTF